MLPASRSRSSKTPNPAVADSQSRYRTAPSPIHGRGVFARIGLRRGQRVGVILGKLIGAHRPGKNRSLYAIGMEKGVLVPRGEPCGLWLMNHSCRANAVLVIKERMAEVVALRAIPAGAEITCDYRPSYHEGKLPCNCGQPGCDGRI